MTVILHASDLHFGTVTPVMMEGLKNEIIAQKPDLVVLSGDFTQEGLRREFKMAREFIDTIPVPVFTIPGNHDIPRYNVWQRFRNPFKLYRKYINGDLDPIYQTDNLFMVGINTARPIVPNWNWAHGMISRRQLDFVQKIFSAAPPEKCRVFVCHHPLAKLADVAMDTIVWNSRELRQILINMNVEMILTGHIHHAYVTLPQDHENRLISIGASTATSWRTRQQKNGYNMIRIGPEQIDVELMDWEDNKFVVLENHTIKRKSVQATPA